MENEIENIQPELKDILDSLHRYIVTNKNNCSMIYNVVAYKKTENKCIECGEECEEVKSNASRFGIYGYMYELREILNQLRDEIEDSADENGFVSI